jgi:hypothetical protein
MNKQQSRILEKAISGPTVFVTKGRQRVKQYENNLVYLKNGDEFELELFNPTSNKILAKISLNGKLLGEGLVLRPGERVFLERYFDESKKFRFETYEIDAKDPNVSKAIEMNGIVDVEFYDEYRKPYVIHYPVYYYYCNYPQYVPCVLYSPTVTTSSDIYTANANLFSSGVTSGSVSYSYSNNDDNMSFSCYCSDVKLSDEKGVDMKETGRVEKGSYSDQHFTYDSTSFNYYCSWKCTWKIMPESRKAYRKEDLKVYCSNCGSRRKKETHKFCPSCGTKF